MQTPIETISLFQPLDDKLLELLRSLSAEEWERPTVAKRWTVKDIAAHLLDGNIRTLSMSRDGYFGISSGNINSYEQLVNYLNGLNADWVHALKRMSPAVLIDLLEHTRKQYVAQLSSLETFGKAIFSVGWAGEDESFNWFHIAREYTEKWHHQQQIREAVNKPGIITQELYHPFLETFMRALPYTYRDVHAENGVVVKITITGEGGGDWYLLKKEKWELVSEINTVPVAHTTIDGNVAWKLFSKSWRKDDALPFVKIEGDQGLGGVVLGMVAVMA
ncbi:MAG: maleylpyruvate isomerase N-terminal domain-containing protein [Chitinophagaceae bacterium]